jgi:hypothetical protein
VIRWAVAYVVSVVSSYFYSRWAHFNTGQFAGLAGAIGIVYHSAIQWAETKFPRLGWLLGVLLQPKTPAVSAVGSKVVS